MFRGDPDCASHRCLTAAAERKTVNGRDDRLSEVLNQVEHCLPAAAGLFGLDWRRMRQLTDVLSCDESLVASPCEDHSEHRSVVARLLESRSQIFPGALAQRIENLGAIQSYVGDGTFPLVQDIGERRRMLDDFSRHSATLESDKGAEAGDRL